jgi:hypothetical protein
LANTYTDFLETGNLFEFERRDVEALAVIALLIIGIIVLYVLYHFFKFIILGMLLWGFRLLPFAFMIYVGIPLWFLNKVLGNIVVVLAFITGVFWVYHGQKENCQCTIHRIENYIFNISHKK